VGSAIGWLTRSLARPLVAGAVLPPATHRPWPLPRRPWIMRQTWEHLLFAHWPLPKQTLRPLVPASLTLETFEGHAWLGVTPFVVGTLRPRAAPGPLAHWLTERYCLYAVTRRGRLRRADIHHAPWPLQPAGAEIHVNTLTRGLGFDLPRAATLLHFAERLDVHVWPPETLAAP
jgi:uncharacterized protein YqjF (DUF2071 family)